MMIYLLTNYVYLSIADIDNINILKNGMYSTYLYYIKKHSPTKAYSLHSDFVQTFLEQNPDEERIIDETTNQIFKMNTKKFVNSEGEPYNIAIPYHTMYWECHPILPIIDIDVIKKTIKKIYLTNDEKERNKMGTNFIIKI